MANRTANQMAYDANSERIGSWKYQIISTNTTTSVAGLTVFHGYELIAPGTNWTLYAFDNATTGYGATTIGILTTTTPGFVNGGDIICNNGLTFTSTNGTAGVVAVLYL